MWFKFGADNFKRKLRVKQVQVAWYDMKHNGDCFDESWLSSESDNIKKTLEKIGTLLPYVETVEDEKKSDRSRVFVHMDDGDVYELQMKKLTKEQFQECNNFYGGKPLQNQ